MKLTIRWKRYRRNCFISPCRKIALLPSSVGGWLVDEFDYIADDGSRGRTYRTERLRKAKFIGELWIKI